MTKQTTVARTKNNLLWFHVGFPYVGLLYIRPFFVVVVVVVLDDKGKITMDWYVH